MSVEIQKEQQEKPEKKTTRRPSLREQVRSIDWKQVQWREILPIAVIMAVGWLVLSFSNNWFQFLAGIVPVSAGLYVGRRVKQQVLLHGLLLGTTGFLVGFVVVIFYAMLGGIGLIPLPVKVLEPEMPPVLLTPMRLIQYYMGFSLFALVPFPALGTVISYRNEQRRREMDAELASRGGQLERPGTVRTLDDLRGLPLAQFGTYVRNLFTKNGFHYKSYQFLNKDKNLDLELEYNGERYLLRLSVDDKVRAGTVETLVQDMRKKEIAKGLVITSTEFSPDVQKPEKGRRNIVLIDGETLFAMAEQ